MTERLSVDLDALMRERGKILEALDEANEAGMKVTTGTTFDPPGPDPETGHVIDSLKQRVQEHAQWLTRFNQVGQARLKAVDDAIRDHQATEHANRMT